MIKTTYEHIYFYKVSTDHVVWECRSLKSGTVLGTVEWYPAWNQFCYFPAGLTLYSASCLSDIRCFIDRLMDGVRK